MKLFISLLVVLFSVESFACRCLPKTQEQYLDDADIVVEGLVISVDRDIDSAYPSNFILFKVDKFVKGGFAQSSLIQIQSYAHSCGYAAVPDQRSLIHIKLDPIFVPKSDEGILRGYSLATGLCMGNRNL